MSQESTDPIYGLVLTGGQSKRMGKNKALLTYNHDKPQAQVIHDLLSPVCEQVFISSRPSQWEKTPLSDLPTLTDRFLDFGPLSGILTALFHKPKSAWLVVACDLPFVDKGIIAHLIANRDHTKTATCFRSAYDGFPEPLCTIYEPRSRSIFLRYLDQGKTCPRKTLINSNTNILDPVESHALDNINDPDSYQLAKRQLFSLSGPNENLHT